jgi:adenylate cyclase
MLRPADNGSPGCGASNPPNARLCGSCGADLAGLLCPACGVTSPVGNRFCNSCGTRLQTPTQIAEPGARPVEAGERKQVSVLFADVVGSMVLAERLDAERLRVVMAKLTRRCARCVIRFERMVDKFTGDGIMALFGAPIALEDHARRACYAGLAMQRGSTRRCR